MKFREYRSLIFLTAASFFAGLSIGYVKFFLLGHLAEFEHSPADKAWIIQAVGALITLGPCLTFVVGGPLASACRKSNIIFLSGIAVAIIMAFGTASSWLGSGWLYVFMAGLGLGLINAARNAAIPIEANRENISTEVVNACVNNLYIMGLLFGVPIGTKLYLISPRIGGWVCSMVFVLCALLGFASKITNETIHLKSFDESFRELFSDCRALCSKFYLYLLISPLLWGIAGALSLAATAYVEECDFAGPFAASLMSIYAAIGVVSGNFISTKLQHKRYAAASVATISLGIAIALIPLIGFFSAQLNSIDNSGYILIAMILTVCGLSFGCATNLVEAEYLSLIYEVKLEGTGAALISALTSLFSFILGGLAALAVLNNLLSSSTEFVFLTSVTCLVCALIVKLRSVNIPSV